MEDDVGENDINKDNIDKKIFINYEIPQKDIMEF